MFTRSLENSQVALFRAKIISSRLPYLFFPFLFAKQSINLICIEAIRLSKGGLGAFRIGLRCLHVKQNGTDCTGSIFVPHISAEQSCGGLLEAERIGFMQSRINTTSIRYKKESDT